MEFEIFLEKLLWYFDDGCRLMNCWVVVCNCNVKSSIFFDVYLSFWVYLNFVRFDGEGDIEVVDRDVVCVL